MKKSSQMRKWMGRVLVALGILAGAASVGSAQWEKVPAEQYRAARSKADELLEKVSHRVRSTRQGYERKPDDMTSQIVERIPPDRVRYSTEYTRADRDLSGEVIQIGDLRFERTNLDGANTGKWRKTKKFEAGPQLKSEYSDETEYFFRTELRADGRRLDVFKVVTVFKFPVVPNRPFKEFDYELRRSTSTLWFDQNGRLLKSLRESEQKGEGTWTTVYEYDPNIKIEAPIK